MPAAIAVERLHTCIEAPEPSFLDNEISTKISLTGLYFVRSALRAATQLPGWEPTDVDDAPASAC